MWTLQIHAHRALHLLKAHTLTVKMGIFHIVYSEMFYSLKNEPTRIFQNPTSCSSDALWWVHSSLSKSQRANISLSRICSFWMPRNHDATRHTTIGKKGIMMVKTATQAWSIWMHEAIDISNTALGVGYVLSVACILFTSGGKGTEIYLDLLVE